MSSTTTQHRANALQRQLANLKAELLQAEIEAQRLEKTAEILERKNIDLECEINLLRIPQAPAYLVSRYSGGVHQALKNLEKDMTVSGSGENSSI